ncbi:glycoside hydrolase family 13 protein [uncultured Eubacterium sp.]|uniref:glycoside hydrolase family 13 protein n=1 Tax=uncultured Eubacterium sp. TaxID=165185 RepID=UPI002626EF77|nr:glycoside hydrolase family 13 protein [uncultured Eubacterium sp.]
MSINQDTLFHDTTNQFCKYDKKIGTYTFILRAGKGTVSKALICMNEVELLMQYKKTKGGFDYFQTTLVLKNEPCRYHFKILNGGKVKFYNFFGTKDYLQEEGEFEITPGFITPDWAKGAVMYQIMVDRFCNGDTTNDVVDNEYAYIGRGVEAVKDWSENPATDGTRQFYGGDLQGVMDKMEYLRKLGVEVIYFNPIFVSPSNHKYDIQDYDYVDPHFGKIVKDGGTPIGQQESTNANADKYKIRTGSLENLEASNELFIKLVEKAHENNIKIIIDGVFNHCGSFNKWMDKEELYRDNANYAPGAYESKDSPYHSYFKFTDENDNNSYEGWWGFDTLPKLNYEGSEKLCKYILDIGKKWVSPPYNVDGWRLDVAADLSHSSEFNHKFWKKFRKVVKEANPNAIILAEHYGDAHSWLLGDEWDTIMNYDAFMDPVTWFLTGVDKHSDNAKPEVRGDADAFNNVMLYQMSRMQSESLLVAMNELSNHDHSRFLTRTNRMVGRIATSGSEAAGINTDEAIFKQGVVMQMTLPGAPTIYYGDEAGVCGWTDPDNRRTYPWGRENLELIEFYKEAICIHKQNQVLKTGSYLPLLWEKDLLCYGRFDEEDAILTVVNTSDEPKTITPPVYMLGSEDGTVWERLIETNREFYNCGRIKSMQQGDVIEVTVKPNSSVIYRKLNK